MPDLPSRTKHESALTQAVASVFAAHKSDLDDPHDVEWNSFRADLQAAIAPKLAVTFATSADQLNRQHNLGLTDDQVADNARRWSDQYTDALSRSIAVNTRKALDKARVKQEQIDQDRGVGAAALVMMGGTNGGPRILGGIGGSSLAGTRPIVSLGGAGGGMGGLVAAGGMEETLDRVFSVDRAERIGITETTRAATMGELGTIETYMLIFGTRIAPDGTDLDEAIWNTAEDEAVCDECDPLDGTGPEVWQDECPNGPPLHVNCRCWLSREPGGDEFESARPGPLAAHVRRVMEGGPGSGVPGHHTDHPDKGQSQPAASHEDEAKADSRRAGHSGGSLSQQREGLGAGSQRTDLGPGEGNRGSVESSSFNGPCAVLQNFPDVRQRDHFSCGAAAGKAVGDYFHVGPGTLNEWKIALNTNIKTSTRPQALVDFLTKIGLSVEARGGMTIKDLAACAAAGQPVICCIQDYAPGLPGEAAYSYGHYITSIGVVPGYIVCQDSSKDNADGVPGGDVPASKANDSGSIEARGKILVEWAVWNRKWHDEDADGTKYDYYGIAVGPKQDQQAPPGFRVSVFVWF